MQILIPIITGQEANEKFLEIALKGAKKVVLMVVADPGKGVSFGSTANTIAVAQETAAEIKKMLGRKRKSSELVMEWGDTASKIDKAARLKRIQKIFLIKQESKEFKKLASQLSKSPEYKTKIVKLE